MGIRSGIGARLFLDQYDLSGDVGSIGQIAAGTNLFDKTTLQKVAVARLSLLRDGQVDFSAFYDIAVGGAQPVLQALPGNATQVTVATGSVVGYDTFSMRGLQATFDDVRAQDGSLVLNTSIMANATATEVGELLTTGLQTFASAGSGSVLTYPGVSTAYGLVAYLHCTALGSGSFVATIQHSSDNVSYNPVTGGAFSSLSGAGKQRIATAANLSILKYTKIVLSGTFTNASIIVAMVRYLGTPHP